MLNHIATTSFAKWTGKPSAQNSNRKKKFSFCLRSGYFSANDILSQHSIFRSTFVICQIQWHIKNETLSRLWYANLYNVLKLTKKWSDKYKAFSLHSHLYIMDSSVLWLH